MQIPFDPLSILHAFGLEPDALKKFDALGALSDITDIQAHLRALANVTVEVYRKMAPILCTSPIKYVLFVVSRSWIVIV